MSERTALILSAAVILLGILLMVATVAHVRSKDGERKPVSAISDYLAVTGKDRV